MPKLRYLITDLFEGRILGTNDEKVAKDYAESHDHFVADTQTCEWLQPGNVREPVREYQSAG